MQSTEWRPVVGFERYYEVSDQGEVRRIAPASGAQVGRSLKPQYRQGNGYTAVNLSIDGKVNRRWIHRLVCAAFHGEPRPGQVTCHNNGVRDDNRAANLRWDTQSENIRESVLAGTHRMANRTHCDHGHRYTKETTYVRANGSRECRICIAARRRGAAA